MCRPSHGLFSRPEAGSRRQLHRAAQREQGAAHLLMTCGFCSCALFSMSCRASLRMYCCAATVFSSDLSGSLTRRGQSRAIFSARRYVASTATRCAADMTRALRERATWFSANSRALAVRHRELNRTRRARQAHTLGSALPGRGGEEHPRCFPAPAARSLCSPPKAQLSLSVPRQRTNCPTMACGGLLALVMALGGMRSGAGLAVPWRCVDYGTAGVWSRARAHTRARRCAHPHLNTLAGMHTPQGRWAARVRPSPLRRALRRTHTGNTPASTHALGRGAAQGAAFLKSLFTSRRAPACALLTGMKPDREEHGRNSRCAHLPSKKSYGPCQPPRLLALARPLLRPMPAHTARKD